MNVLILSAATGGGHNTAAAALKKEMEAKYPDDNVKVVDTLKYVSHFFDKLVVNGYFFCVKVIRHTYGVMYRLADKKSPLSGIVTLFTKHYGYKLKSLVDEFKPDVVISTHPFTGNMMACYKQKYKPEFTLISIVTDYAPHRAYVNDTIDKYIVSSNEMIAQMQKYDVPAEKVLPLGIPIDRKFYARYDRKALYEELGFNADKPTALFMAGSFGVNSVLKIYKNISALPDDFQVIIITGKNHKLYEKFKAIIDAQVDNSKKTLLIEFTDKVDKYMQAADMIITKPGGLTVTESLASHLPIVIFEAYPGQEDDNRDYLIRSQAGVSIDKPKQAADVFRSLISDTERLNNMRNSCAKISCPHSAENICKLIHQNSEQ